MTSPTQSIGSNPDQSTTNGNRGHCGVVPSCCDVSVLVMFATAHKGDGACNHVTSSTLFEAQGPTVVRSEWRYLALDREVWTPLQMVSDGNMPTSGETDRRERERERERVFRFRNLVECCWCETICSWLDWFLYTVSIQVKHIQWLELFKNRSNAVAIERGRHNNIKQNKTNSF